ncbi:MAG: hypothetical protein IT320_03995 [Anaerolineae bacterium]|nr:hypothetical protein [Anaerolineae bacterium]
MSIDNTISANVAICIVLWAVIYTSDFALTMIGAHLYRRYVSEHVDTGGSYELNPILRRDVDRQRLMSPRFLILLILTVLYLLFVADFFKDVQFFVLVIGMLYLIEVPVHFRHFQNIRLSLMLRSDPTLAQGHIAYKRVLSYKLLALDFVFYGVLWLIFALANSSIFFLGGALGCLIEVVRFYWLGQRIQRAEETRPPSPAPSEST